MLLGKLVCNVHVYISPDGRGECVAPSQDEECHVHIKLRATGLCFEVGLQHRLNHPVAGKACKVIQVWQEEQGTLKKGNAANLFYTASHVHTIIDCLGNMF